MSAIPVKLADRLATQDREEQSVGIIPPSWERWLGNLDVVEISMEGNRERITRQELCTFVEANAEPRPLDAFVRVLQWGYGNGGRGPSRARKILVGGTHDKAKNLPYLPEVGERLARSIEVIQASNARDSYSFMRHGDGYLKGLGPAFFTKWMYAVSANGDAFNATAFPILDELIQTWVGRETQGEVRLRYGSASDYARYVDLLDHWAETSGPTNLTRIDVEQAIFTLERERRRNKETSE